jgi:hypothetical protein
MSLSFNFQKVCSLILLLIPALVIGQSGYLDYSQMSNRLRELAKNPNTKLESYGKSFGNKDLWVIKLGSDNNPAILMVGGLDGRHQAGTLAAVSIADKILATDSLKNLLSSKSVYIIPNGNPDAIDAYFSKIKFEKSGNARLSDDDRNGRIGDDPYNDLNGDGIISMMRVSSQAGDYITNDKDPRHMVKADAAKDQKGTHLLISEGVDDNKNGEFNEDPSNGVNVDRNFAFDHPYFKQNSGEYAASENEVRALMDFLAAHTNIHTVVNFGPQNNLTEPLKYDARVATQRIIKGWQESDIKVNEAVSKSYNKHNSLKNAPSLPMQAGSFAQTAYFHAGKYSFSTPVWWASEVAKKDSSKTDMAAPQMPASGGRAPGAGSEKDPYEITFLKWMDQEGNKELFVEWKEVKHPDFPNNKVEVGGIQPYALYNPPAKYIQSQVAGHVAFLSDIIKKMPTHNIVDPKVEKLNDNLYRVSVTITNKGGMPSYSAINDKLRFTSRIKTELKLTSGQSRVSGKKISLENGLQPNESRTHTWLVTGKGSVTVESGCNTTGISKISLDLK